MKRCGKVHKVMGSYRFLRNISESYRLVCKISCSFAKKLRIYFAKHRDKRKVTETYKKSVFVSDSFKQLLKVSNSYRKFQTVSSKVASCCCPYASCACLHSWKSRSVRHHHHLYYKNTSLVQIWSSPALNIKVTDAINVQHDWARGR